MGLLKNRMAVMLKDEADVICKTHEVELEIRDLEETTTIEKVKETLQKIVGTDITLKSEFFRLCMAFR